MAYTSILAVHRLDRSVEYVMDKDKTSRTGAGSASSLAEAVDDARDREKTECGVFESAIGCTLDTAYRDMRANKERWGRMDGVQGYHLVQSFAEGELTPELAHRIGLELAERLLHGQYPAVVATHLNTHCLHNHIVWDSVAMDTGRKYRSSARTYYTGVRAESDRLCRQYGLSVIESPESERGKKQYGKWLAEQNGKPTWRTAIRQDVDSAIAASLTWRQFVKALEGFQNIAQYFNEDMNSINQDEMFALYYDKKAAMFFDGAWSVGTMIQNCPEDVLATTHVGLMPAVEGESGTKYDTAAGAGWNYVINSRVEGDDLKAVLAFLKAITTGEYADDALQQGFISAAKTSENADMSTLAPLFAEYYDLAAQMNNCSIFDCVLPAEVGSGVLYADTQQLIAGSMTPEDMAADCQAALEANY